MPLNDIKSRILIQERNSTSASPFLFPEGRRGHAVFLLKKTDKVTGLLKAAEAGDVCNGRAAVFQQRPAHLQAIVTKILDGGLHFNPPVYDP